jgi:aspartate ammonia-lyase
MQNTRPEHDSLGTIEVPQSALYGAQTARALQNYQISGRLPHPALIRAYLRIKAAAARANQTCGVLESGHSGLIERAVDELIILDPDKLPGIFPLDPYQAGAGTSQNMNINEVIANVANRIAGKALGSYSPIHPNDHVNRSQSTNDSFPTAMRIALLEASREVANELRRTAHSLLQKAHAWKEIPKSARTHLQDAVPMRLGQEFMAYSGTISRCAQWIEDSRDELRELGIGGSAAGTGLTVPAGYVDAIIPELSRLTGEALRSAPDLCEAMQSQSPVMHYSSMLRLTALELTRICNDLRLLASGPMTGLAEIHLPAVQPGSSIMPGKVNPSILEAANQAFFGVLGHDQTVAFAMQAGQLELNVMMPVMADHLLQASDIAARALRMLRERCIDGLQPNASRLKRYFEGTPQVATALSPRLGYEQTAKLVQEALASGQSVVELVRARGLIPESELAELLAPERLLGPS